ncbi:porin family protein [Arsenicitalea aurantiaca]|uniref:Porin family protein n=1 Tax=Arsenicitalea aurantiaca TaxID=1783274 RepID=A0A433XF19_9HYPH|nr:outer membrane beta-barrel protein [Arsenicitalea aurantiaca]RUT32662.1 porin family protein [Arsenicitalea aurantiaca]
MIRKFLLGTALALVASAGAVKAADFALPNYDVAMTSTYDWTGFYVGVVGGAGILNTNFSDVSEYLSYNAVDLSDWGGSLGVTAGYNYQIGSAVFGLEGDLNWASMSQSYYDDYEDTQYNRSWDWYSTIRLRAGVATDNALFYATAGVAMVGVDLSGVYDPDDYECGEYYSFCVNETQFGFALGAGAEIALNDSTSLKLEGMYIGLPTTTESDPESGYDDVYIMSSSAVLARAGLNFRF